MPSEFKIAHRVKRCSRAGQYCGRETEIVITLPQKDYRRLTRSLGWRSVHWPAERSESAGKLPIKPAKRCTLRPRWKPRKLNDEPVENRSPRPRGRPRKTPEPRPPVEAVEVRDPLTLPPSLAGGPEDMFMALPITHTDPFVPALTSAVRVQVAPPAKPRRCPRVPERDRFVEPDVPYVLQTLREMLAVAEQKEAYHQASSMYPL